MNHNRSGVSIKGPLDGGVKSTNHLGEHTGLSTREDGRGTALHSLGAWLLSFWNEMGVSVCLEAKRVESHEMNASAALLKNAMNLSAEDSIVRSSPARRDSESVGVKTDLYLAFSSAFRHRIAL